MPKKRTDECFIELYTSNRKTGGMYRWRMKANNGEILASGEGYHNKEDRARAVELVLKAGRNGCRIQILDK